MQIQRNVGPKERIFRVVTGILMILCGLVALEASTLGWAVAAVGAVSLLTGLIRYCPACALTGKQSSDCR